MKKILFILFLLVSSPALAGLSKWVDADGKVHYSDQPPPANVKVKILRADVSPASSVAASAPVAPRTIAEREVELKKSQLAKKEAAEKIALEQSKIDAEKANCAAAQQSLRTLQDGMRMVVIDAKGERSFLDDEQRRQRIEKRQQEIRTLCK